MSESTTSANSCPKCGAALPSTATVGLCPRCLLAEAMAPTQVDADPSAQPPLPPDQIAPHFPQLEILECLGRGGMGVVYKARQKSLNRIVALKLLAPERVRDPKFAERFTREAQALATLNHPNIVTIHDFGLAGGFYYLLMEFVDGVNLRQLLRARKFTPEEALAVVPPLCDALQYAHNRGIVHRDIKPENLLLDKEGRVKVADFGIAKMLGTAGAGGAAAEPAEPENATQSTVGTPAYCAPEQKTDPRRVDSRADIYSLGVVFYEMLTGELPGKRLEPPSAKVQIDVRLDEVVLRALEREPERRYQTAGELKTVIETVVAETLKSAGAGSFAPGTGAGRVPSETTALPATRWPRTAIAGAVGIGCFLVVIILWLVDWPASSDPNFGHTLPQILFRSAVLPAGLVAVLAGTILGWIAVVRIRRSAGRLRGLRLAAFEGLFLPLLTVDLFILIAWAVAVKALAASRGLGGSMFRNLWDFAAFTLLLGLVTGWVDYLIIKPVWRAISGNASGGAPGASAHTQRSLRWLAVAFGLAVVILYPAYVMLNEDSRKARYGWGVEDGTELNCQVFEADAALVDQRVPFEVREPGNALSSAGTYTLAPTYTAAAQMAEIDEAILSALQPSAATNSGLLVNTTRKGENIYQWSPDAWSYHTGQASGKGQGFCGMGRDRQSDRFRIRYQVSHIVGDNATHPVTAEISYEGPMPAREKARAFFIPFGRDRQAKYLVIVFAAKAASTGAALEPTALAQAAEEPADPRLGSKVKYVSAQASVQDIVQSLAEQVGLGYDWQKSFAQTDPLCRQWVRNVAIEGKTCKEALEQVLKPVGLRYQVEKGVLVLSRRDGVPQPPKSEAQALGSQVKYTSEQASVQDIVQSLAEQVGLGYDWQKSFNQTAPLCRQWVRNVAIEHKTCKEALEQVLKPVGLRYQVEKGVLVLSRQNQGTPPAGPVELKLKWPPVGERMVLDVERKRNGEYLTPGQPEPLKETATLEKKYGLTVLQATPGGGYEVELEFLGIRDRIALGGKTKLDYDSTQKSSVASSNSLADLYGRVVGSKIRYFLNASNEVERMEGVDELETRLSGAPAGAFSKLQFGGDYLKQMMKGLHDYLPPKAVQPGDTWPFQEAIAMNPIGTVNLDFTVAFQKWELRRNRNCARLEFQSTLTAKPAPNSNSTGTSISSFEGTVSGVAWFDPELGMIIETAANNDMKMVITNLPIDPNGNPGDPGSAAGTVYQWHDAVNTTLLER